VVKVPSIPTDPSQGVLAALGRLAGDLHCTVEDVLRDCALFVHGSTVATNRMIEGKGAKVGLLITKGFRAIQEVQGQARDGNLFDYFYAKPIPIAPQSLTREIPERLDYTGQVLVPLDRDAVRRAARGLCDAGVQSIAVCFLFSFMNPGHEEETRRIIAQEAPDISVSLSSEVLPRLREWARLSTTLVNMGEIRAIGARPEGTPWRVGLADPDRLGAITGTVDLVDRAVATSAGAGFRFDRLGRFTHLFDPATGRSPSLYSTVSVIAPTATEADALSTAFSLMPLSRIQDIVAIRPKVQARIIDSSGTSLVSGA
jgi:hypothetical protein